MKTEKQIEEDRHNQVAKSNDIIQKARYDLSVMELKTLSFMMSMIKPTDAPRQRYTFSITDYCRVRGIDEQHPNTRNAVKASLQSLRDKSFWIQKGKKEILCSWIEKPIIEHGQVSVRFDEDVEEYIMGLINKGNYTQYELLYTLPMKSKYSIRLYELLKSWIDLKNSKASNKFRAVKQEFDLDDLRKRLGIEDISSYAQFRELKRRVLDPAIKEVNEYTDITTTYLKLCKGRTVTGLQFEVKYKDFDDLLAANKKVDAALDKADQIPGQLNIYDMEKEKK